MKKKILVVAPYEGLLELFATILPRYSDRIEIETVVGNLEEGLKKARKAEEQGFDAIISRGGTTEMIRAEVSLPVIDIEVSGYDYIRAIKMASNYSGKSALVGFPRITSAANSINELLHTDINIVTVNSSKQVVPALERLRKEGYSLILGDMIAVRVAKEMDFNILLLTSGEESVSNALESTLYICDCVDGYRKQRDLLKQLVETAPETILAYGPGGEPLYQNGQVEALGLHEQDVQRYTDNILAGGRQDAVVSGKLGEVTLRGRRLGKGQEDVVAFYLRHVGGVRNKIKGVSFKNMGMGGAAMGPNIFAESNTRYEKETVEVARACCDTEHSVLILGQVGVGKAILAESIHRGSGRNLGPFMRLDCGLMDQEDWEELDAHWSEILPVLRQGSICLREVDGLDSFAQKLFLSKLESGGLAGCRLISTATRDLHSMVSAGTFLPRLYDALAEVSIYLPSLSERMDEFKDIASLFIIGANTKYGKQVVGFTPEAFQQMKKLPWQGNYDQLKTVIGQMVLTTPHTYLDEEDIRRATEEVDKAAVTGMVLEGTLDEIIARVIDGVLREEGGNASRAAKRLGIGRSTLWRRMKMA